MKKVLKGAKPSALVGFKSANPAATWHEMRHDAMYNGRQAAHDCLTQATIDQKGLCAYCETKIDPEMPCHCRVEHFHPKSDTSTGHNWNLEWPNMLAACNGGETDKTPDNPLPDNLSCDAHKNHLINKGKLTVDVEMALINPLDLPAFPNAFAFNKATGRFQADAAACKQAGVNACKLQRTINVLNLNCNRLATARRNIVINIEKNKEALRKRHVSPEKAANLLAKRYFAETWPEFFTTIRCCLGSAAETYLQNIQYNG